MSANARTIDDDSGARSSATDTYRKDKGKVLGWAAASLGGLAITIGFAAHNKLWSHDIAIATIQTTQTAQEKRLDGMDLKLDQILAELRNRRAP